MTTDAELIEIARSIVNPKVISPSATAGSVGSALVTGSGAIYKGVCVDTHCSLGFCAEHNAIGSMVTEGETHIKTIVALHKRGNIISPCGRCREFIYQIDVKNAETRVILGKDRVVSLRELLPEHWIDTARVDTDSKIDTAE